MPLLRDVLALLRGRLVTADIELKVCGGDGAALAAAVLEDVALCGAGAAVRVRSFDFGVLRSVRQACAVMPVAWLTAAGAGLPDVLAELSQRGWPDWQPVWAPDHCGLTRQDVAAAAAAGIAVHPWTVNTPARMREMFEWGVAGLCTDRPDIALMLAETAAATQNPA